MDWIIWLIVIVLIVAVVWWLLNRNNSRGNESRSAGAPPAAAATPGPAVDTPVETAPPARNEAHHGAHAAEEPPAPVHHSEYTEPHAPTLPGAESAAAEAETLQAAASSAATEGSASHAAAPAPEQPAEPAGHLAAEEPYGAGSAAPAADGSGPGGYTVKGDAATMTYYEETSPGFEETRAAVWFESSAHAEAAGFRPPRRARL